MPIITDLIGFTAAVVGTSLMLPQVVKSLKTKKLDDISAFMLILYLINCLLWLIYGSLILAWPVIVCNFLALVISVVLLVLKSKYSSLRS